MSWSSTKMGTMKCVYVLMSVGTLMLLIGVFVYEDTRVSLLKGVTVSAWSATRDTSNGTTDEVQRMTSEESKRILQGQTKVTGTEKRLEILLYGLNLKELERNQYDKVRPLTFLREYKNPCWLERLLKSYEADYNSSMLAKHGRKAVESLAPVFDHRLATSLDPWRLRCLPYFYLTGVTKSGTTDFYFGLMRNSHVLRGWVKEPMYWNRHRYPNGVVVHQSVFARHIDFGSYLNMFDYSAHLINSTDRMMSSVIVDGSSYLFWEDNGWPSHPGNKNLEEPKFTTPMALHAAQPDAKLIVLLREPAARVYSAYIMYTARRGTAKQFHNLVVKSVDEYMKCFKRSSLRACAYNVTLSQTLHPITLRGSMYYIFLKDWYAAFKKEQILVIKAEDYFKNRVKYYDIAFKFLSVNPLTEKENLKLKKASIFFRQKYDPISNKTKFLLDNFFKPFNDKLEMLLNRKMWH